MRCELTVLSRASYTALTNLALTPESSMVLKDPFASRCEEMEEKGGMRKNVSFPSLKNVVASG